MKKPCGNVANCTEMVDDKEDSHIHVEGRYYCSSECLSAYMRQADLFEFALMGQPILDRRPRREAPRHAKDG